jgi:hypothetical protein
MTMNPQAHRNVAPSAASTRPRIPLWAASTAMYIVTDERISTTVLMPAIHLLSASACLLNSAGAAERRTMYVPRIAMKNMISLARNIQMAIFPGGVGSPWPITGSGACSSGT